MTTKHVLIFLADPELSEHDPQPTKPDIVPVVPGLPADTPEVIEPAVQAMSTPYDYDEHGYTYQETLDAMKYTAMLKTKKVVTKPAPPASNKATLFQNGKPKHAKAAAA